MIARHPDESWRAEAYPSFRKVALAAAAISLLAGAALLLMRDVVHARARVIAAACLVLWLSELVPPFVPTFLVQERDLVRADHMDDEGLREEALHEPARLKQALAVRNGRRRAARK